MTAFAAAPAVAPALSGRHLAPPAAGGLVPQPETIRLVRGLAKELLLESPGFRALGADDRRAVAHGLVHVGSYLAELVRDDFYQSQEHLGQRPVIVERRPLAQAQATDFQPSAAGQIGSVTTETLRAVAFPVFVADLIRGTFNAIGDASQKQMEAYMELLANVGKTVDDYMDDEITDGMAADWLVQKYPQHFTREGGGIAPAKNPPAGSPPNFTADLDLTESVERPDAATIRDTLVPAARRKLAQSRLQLLSALVLMGINRIVVTGGKLRAAMGFHISTRDQAHAESASGVDARTSASGTFGAGWWSASASMSLAYVSSTKADSNAQLNTQTDLTGEVELHFQSDYFPIERFADAAGIDRIRSNTPVPAANTPVSIPWGDTSGLPAPDKMAALPTPATAPVAVASPAPTAPTPPELQKTAAQKPAEKPAEKPPAAAPTEAKKPPPADKTPPPAAKEPAPAANPQVPA